MRSAIVAMFVSSASLLAQPMKPEYLAFMGRIAPEKAVDQAIEIVRGVRGLNVIGGDVVCLMPTKDQRNNITSMVAAAVMFELISLIAEKMPAP